MIELMVNLKIANCARWGPDHWQLNFASPEDFLRAKALYFFFYSMFDLKMLFITYLTI